MRECINCHKEYKGTKRQKVCSLSCSSKYSGEKSRSIPNITCPICGELFYRSKSEKKTKSGINVCSRKCQSIAQSLEKGLIKNNRYDKGIRSYRKNALKFTQICGKCSFNIVELLVVHHRDGDRNNNVLSNLEVLCPNHHAMAHFKNGRLNFGDVV